ncbi:radical SAM protein [Chloroflexota bacterium]
MAADSCLSRLLISHLLLRGSEGLYCEPVACPYLTDWAIIQAKGGVLSMTYRPGVDNQGFVPDLTRLKTYSFEIGAIRPPSEGGSFSLLLRVTRNCPWSRCTFCYGRFYNRERFELRPVDEVKTDIDSAKAISNEIQTVSDNLGLGGKIEPLAKIFQTRLLYGKELISLSGDEMKNFHCLVTVYNWLVSGGKTVFLQDADTLIMYTDQLVEVIKYLKKIFPSIERITSYARSKTVIKKKPEELSLLNQAGLNRLHIGLESGDDELLKSVDKGVTAEEHILAGKKALEAGFELSEYVMPGLAGKSGGVQHAVNTARVLSEINPHFIRLRPFMPSSRTPLLEAYRKGEFEITSPHESLREIRLMIENLEVSSRVCFDHNLNPSYRSGNNYVPLLKHDFNGYKFPEEKNLVLGLIDEGLKMDEEVFLDIKDFIGTDSL